MESLLKPMKLSPDFNRALEEIRNGAENALYGAVPAASEELFKRHVESLIEGAGLPSLQVIHYRWFLRELARLWRTRRDRDLAFHLELTIRKWVNLGLEPRTLQFLICEAHQRLKGQDSTTKTQSHEVEGDSGALDCGSAAPAFPDRTDGPEKAAAVLPHSTELRSPTQTPSAKSVDVLSGSAPHSTSTPAPDPQSPTPEVR